jgi:nucleoside-diphosphate-sugar epimerase
MGARRVFSGMKVLVTGASGFIGPHLYRRLHALEAEVHAVSRTFHASSMDGFRWRQADLANINSVRNLLVALRPEVIFHLAGHAAGGRDLERVLPTFHSNLTTTVNLLTAAAEVGCRRIVLASSLEEPQSEAIESVPSSPYAASKWAGSAYGRMFHALYQAPVVLARIFMTYGPGYQDQRKLIPYVILSLLRGEAPKLASGEREIDWIYVDDVVEGLLAVARAAGVEGKTIDIGSGELVSIRTLVRHLVRLINPDIEPLFGALDDRPLEQVRVAEVANSLNISGWEPAVSLEEGLKRTVDWYARRQEDGRL